MTLNYISSEPVIIVYLLTRYQFVFEKREIMVFSFGSNIDIEVLRESIESIGVNFDSLRNIEHD